MQPHNPRLFAFEQIALAMRNFNVRAQRLLDRLMAAKGASFSRYRMLALLRDKGPLRSTDLAELFSFAPRTVTEAIDGLERDDLVRRDPDPEDRRAKRISVTPAGEAMISGSKPIRDQFFEDVFGALTPDELADLLHLINKLDDRLNAMEA